MVASPLTLALIEQLVRLGVMSADDIDDMATRLDADGDTADAHLCRTAFVKAHAPTQQEWEEEQRRARLRVVPDGGNATT